MPTPKILPAILVAVPAALVLTGQASFGEPQTQECRPAPGSSTPPGGHWHYRINHKDQQRCWYLSSSDARVSGQTAPPLSASAPALRKRSAGDAVAAAPPEVATAEIGFPQPSFAVLEERQIFASRWPEHLPSAQTLNVDDSEQTYPVAPGSSYAESRAEADTSAQMLLRWPIIEADRAEQMSVVESILRSFSIAGGILMVALLLAGWAARFVGGRDRRLMVALLLAGWAARFVGGRDRRPRADRWSVVTARISPRWPVVFAEVANGVPAQARRGTGQAVVPTDPARDLKTSLAELIRDLRRAETASGPVRSPKRRVPRNHNGADRQPCSPRDMENRDPLVRMDSLVEYAARA